MFETKPLIGLNMYLHSAPHIFSYLSAGYYNAIIKAGGVPILIPPLQDEADIDRILDLLDAIILVGGADLDCERDGFQRHPSMRIMPPEREAFDRLLVRLIAERKMPVMGIGAGMQLLNMSQGGTLFLHIPEDRPKAIPHTDVSDPLHRHSLRVKPDTFMSLIYPVARNGVTIENSVNSQHHMAVDDVAQGFTATAHCPNGIIEAIESTTDWLALGVQFHPESETASLMDAMIFDEFIAGVMQRTGFKMVA